MTSDVWLKGHRSADHGAVDRIDARVILAAAATGPLRFPIISLFARRSLDAHRWRLRPESPRRRQLRALLSLPLRAVLVLVGGMLLPLLRAMSLLVTTRIGRTGRFFKGRPRSTPCETALLFRLTVH